ncbi:PACE efflux transporter [Roseivivax sediminis]|uniref:Uncharacterized membrane protein n=1 Tax=Roseivivax sediminis TaxID=936889 RepID=A0A1I1UTG9_9RHOB|nr:PACE efflux transporter [Roseivivax sediminis]SFD74056.1 Uncharacterized membrane protein [Roseivivax sediminis]
MRRPLDRIRHAILFEAIALTLVTPATAWIFGIAMHDSFVVIAVGATVAMVWNYVYNLAFDHALVRLGLPLYKTLPLRIGHAILFECGLILALVPFFKLWLGIGAAEAIVMNLGLSAFYTGYALAFNWGYDRLFPLPEWREG